MTAPGVRITVLPDRDGSFGTAKMPQTAPVKAIPSTDATQAVAPFVVQNRCYDDAAKQANFKQQMERKSRSYKWRIRVDC